MSHPLEKLDAPTALARLLAQDVSSARFVFVGQVCSPDEPLADRLFVHPVDPVHPVHEPGLANGEVLWLLTPELPALVEGLASRVGARLGGSSAMFAVGGHLCWAPALGPEEALAAQTPLERWPDPATRAPFVLFEEGKLTCRASAESLFAGGQLVPTEAIEKVAYVISPDWCDREVSAVLRDGRKVRIAFDTTTDPLAGPMVYDGFDLLMDSGWGRQVAAALGAVLGKPVEVPP